MVPPSVVIGGVDFGPDGSVMITFTDSEKDVRNRGLVAMQHQVVVQPGEGGKDYGDEIQALHDAARTLLHDALEDFASTPPASEQDLSHTP